MQDWELLLPGLPPVRVPDPALITPDYNSYSAPSVCRIENFFCLGSPLSVFLSLWWLHLPMIHIQRHLCSGLRTSSAWAPPCLCSWACGGYTCLWFIFSAICVQNWELLLPGLPPVCVPEPAVAGPHQHRVSWAYLAQAGCQALPDMNKKKFFSFIFDRTTVGIFIK